jgi:hypothetical protein
MIKKLALDPHNVKSRGPFHLFSQQSRKKEGTNGYFKKNVGYMTKNPPWPNKAPICVWRKKKTRYVKN